MEFGYTPDKVMTTSTSLPSIFARWKEPATKFDQ